MQQIGTISYKKKENTLKTLICDAFLTSDIEKKISNM